MNEKLIEKIKARYPYLSKTHQIIADVIFLEETKLKNITIIDFAKKSFCSPSTINMFIKIFGYESYKVFMNDLFKTETTFESNTLYNSFEMVDVFFINNKKIIKKLTDAITKADTIYVCACGLSKLPALDFVTKLKYINAKKIVMVDGHESFNPGNISESDLCILVSNSGGSKQLVPIAKTFPYKNTFLITNRDNSVLSKFTYLTYNLNNNLEEKEKFMMFPRESKYSLLYFFDLLFEQLHHK